MKLIVIDDGHGMETPGKRTPTLPGEIKDTETGGSFIHENEFNRAVVAKLNVNLERCGFRTLLVAPGDKDTPLEARTDAANAAKADLYVSVHANAIGSGGWNGTRGIETFHYTKASEGSKRAAAVLHRNLMAGTKLPDRGVKAANFHVLRETHMPAVLVECGFMTDQDDARLLLSDAYRSECAEELARGICEYFAVPFVRVDALPQSPPVTSGDAQPPVIQRLIKGWFNGEDVPEPGYLINDKTYVTLRWIAESLDAEVSWDPDKFEYTLQKGGV